MTKKIYLPTGYGVTGQYHRARERWRTWTQPYPLGANVYQKSEYKKNFRKWLRSQGAVVDTANRKRNLNYAEDAEGIAPSIDQLRFKDSKAALWFIMRWAS